MMHPETCSSAADPRLPAILLAALLLTGCGSSEADDIAAAAETVAVQKGNLRISVLEGGDLESANPVTVRSEVEGRSAILGLVTEGTQVKKGDWLVKLDSSALQDNLNRQEIKFEDARSAQAQAEEAVAIQRKKNMEDETSAQTDWVLAENALKGYVDGSRPLEEAKLLSSLTIAKEKFARAKDKMEASQRLQGKEYISLIEYQADVLAFNQTKEEVDIAERNLKHFEKYTAGDEITRLTSDRDVKKLALDRVRQQAESELKQKLDSLEARKKAFILEKEARDKLTGQLSKTTIIAPADGLVVYARQSQGGRMGGNEPIGLGKEVREQEEILRIPDLSQMVVEVDIHESSIKKIQVGQRAWVTVDAIPNKTFPGMVTRVSLVPSTQSSWMNPDLKVYETKVKLEETVEGVKPGMHAQVEILVEEIQDALQVPLQAVRQTGQRNFVYARNASGKPELREVKVGLNNNIAVHVLEGVKERELVYLATPPGAPPLPEPEESPFRNAEPAAAPPGAPGMPVPGSVPPGGGAAAGPERPADDGNMPGGRGSGRRGNMTEEERKAWSDRMAAMTPEEREKMRERRGGRRGDGQGGERGGTPAAPAGTEPGRNGGN